MPYVIPLAAILLVFLGAKSERLRNWIVPREPSRPATAASAALLAGLGYLFSDTLIANRGDNAYLLLWMTGAALYLCSMPFVIATLLPQGNVRRLAVLAGVALVAMTLSWGGPFLLLTIVFYGGDYERVFFVNHLIALAILTPAALFVMLSPRLARLSTH